MKTVLLPVKDFSLAKQRLTSALEPLLRAGLAKAMLCDVMTALSQAKTPQRVIVYTASPEASALARHFQFEVIAEPSIQGHSAAVNQMVKDFSGSSSHILSLAGDLPTITAAEIDSLFRQESAISLVPSRDGTGTNAALFISPAHIQMEYGPDSLRRHLSNAVAAGYQAEVLRLPGIEFDIDTPEDLQSFRESRSAAQHTWSFLGTLEP